MTKKPLFIIICVALVAFFLGSLSGGVAGSLIVLSRLEQNPLHNIINNPESSAGISKESAQAVARAEEDATVLVAKEAGPAVVSIIISKEIALNNQMVFPFDDFESFFANPPIIQAPANAPKEKKEIGGGSGFIVKSDGLIITNRHVVSDEAASYTVLTSDGKKYDAKVLAIDPVVDVAVLKIEAEGLPTLSFGDSDAMRIGQTVIAIGNALSEFQNSVTKGVVSGLNRRVVAASQGVSEIIEEAIQTDAAINPGNSGGPLLDLGGRVVGMNTAIEGSGQLIGFAIPSNIIDRIVQSVEKNGKIVRPWLGVRYILLDQRPDLSKVMGVNEGALVISGGQSDQPAVVAGSPAEKAGIKERDIITKVDGQAITKEKSLSSLISKKNPEDQVVLTIQRSGQEVAVNLTLGVFDEAELKK
ncbi:MAG: trypsin-like peptidase domain-containing protein [bacterium]